MDEEDGSQLSADAREQLEEFIRTGGPKRLARYAASELHRRRFHGVWGGLAPGGVDGDDLAQEAIGDLVARIEGRTGKGSRAWNPERELIKQLCDIVDSKIYKLVRRPENQAVTPESATPVVDDGEEGSFLEAIESADPSPEAALLRKERIEAFWDSIEDDPDLQRAIALKLEEELAPRELAERMGKGVDEVYNLQRRLRRRLAAFERRWSEAGRETPETVKGK